MSRCDIIIPIYNAHDCVAECIKSVLENTDFDNAHLILIDDKSPDERILPLLEKYEKRNPDKITVLKNEKNLGFVGTVNKGMKYSKNDVLLLNSDTEVPKGWLNRIMECAYSDDLIATVTPLSNNATLASVPKMFQRNELPDNYSLEDMDKLVQQCSDRIYPEIPTAHGFCMYIKRTALNKVGFFDEENFGKGYGEENDFSFRCFEFGYRNVLCDNVYVLHKESQSFLGDKVDHSAKLAAKHPVLKNGLDRWCHIRDTKNLGDNIALALGLKNARPNILLLVHDFNNINENVGGTTLHILDVVTALRHKYNFHVFSPEGGIYKVHSFFENTDVVTGVYKRPFIIEPVGLRSNSYRQILDSIMTDYKISFVHIHHMLGHYFNIIDSCKSNKIKYAVSLHDFYLDVPVPSMMDEKVNGKTESPIDLAVWHSECKRLLDNATEVIAPSDFTKHNYEKVYKTNIKVINHGVAVDKNSADTMIGAEKNIAFIGAVFPHKGSNILENMVDVVKKRDKIKIHLFGTTTADIRSDNLYINHGKYKRQDLAKLMKKNQISLVCIFSLAPETYAYTVDEAVAAGVPVLSFDIGAGAERIKTNKLGWVIDYTSDGHKIITEIKKILEDEDKYKKTLKSINNYKPRSVEEMAIDYDKIYKKYAKKDTLDAKTIKSNMLKADLVLNAALVNGGSNYADEYFSIINSTKWKLVSRVKVPQGVKKPIKKIYKKLKG